MGGFQFQVRGFDLPPLVVELDDFRCRECRVVGQGGDQPVAADAAFSVVGAGAGHHDLGVDHPQTHVAEPGQVRAVRAGTDPGQDAAVLASDQQVRAGGVDLCDQGLRCEVAIREQQHARPMAMEKSWGVGCFADASGPEDGIDDGAGAARDHREQPQQRIPGAAVGAALAAVTGQVRRTVGQRQRRPVDRADQQPPPPRRPGRSDHAR